jgi:hypothetical protein
MRTLIDFFEIQPMPLDPQGSRITMLDLEVTWEEAEPGPVVSAEALRRARWWLEE